MTARKRELLKAGGRTGVAALDLNPVGVSLLCDSSYQLLSDGDRRGACPGLGLCLHISKDVDRILGGVIRFNMVSVTEEEEIKARL